MKNKMKKKTHTCPYCGSTAVLRDAKYVYGNNALVSHLYVCARYPECNSYVNVHERTKEPMGTLANGDLRNKRIKTHKVFDRIWKNGIMTKTNAYWWMRVVLNLNESQAHIASLSEPMCDKLILACEKTLNGSNTAGG